MLRFNKSRDGELRATIRVEYRCGKDMLQQGVLMRLTECQPKPTSRRAVEEAVRTLLHRYTDDWAYAQERWEPDEEDIHEASDIVERLFPEL